ncbi:helix-turn-helix domain-containing protein [Kerstersia gyiorum]|uniref:helix-turn-helix domain-containing protein n=1 Tax=Kerstersia gyiorum TaxID=206506 RepID=UPI00209DF1A7|nr:helix-turn-helix domain-containing protein [Kerstersia gyiorum]MCP1635580.1 AraC-like DNA-binding protein [Kerstersia gyiorum]MCP1671014.1 AraC-like DNA-binding protein [Kerstersia gyiorum]MCP1708644.1 AraC-like DNA-binding protein [Kerstersia gyiorum]
MQPTAAHPVSQISTNTLPPSQRLDYWESYNASMLVGLKCSAFSDDGLLATQRNLMMGDIRLAEIQANEHVIERTPQMVRRHPKDSVFASLILESNAFFYQGSSCTQLEPGDLILYDTRHAYLFGFTGSMRQFLLDTPADWFYQSCSHSSLTRPLHVPGGSGPGRVLNAALRRLAAGTFAEPASTSADQMHQQAGELLRSLLAGDTGNSSALRATYLQAARSHIDSQLDDHTLDAERVAGAAGITLRHLNRLLEPEGRTVSQLILERRLDRAASLLRRRDMQRYSIAEISWRCSFSSPAHFARTFRARHALTPTQMREAALSG